MSKTKISWSEYSWSPVIGCTKVSAGCANCYAERMAARLWRMGRGDYGSVLGIEDYKWNGEIFCRKDFLDKPLHWRKPRRIFVCSMSDLFHEKVPWGFIEKVMATIEQCPQHTFQILTKRPQGMAEYFNSLGKRFELSNCLNLHLGVTCENQAMADERIPILLQIPCAVRFVSIEPMLGSVDLEYIKDFKRPNKFVEYERIYSLSGRRSILGHEISSPKLDQVIVGCESGPKRRPCKMEWVRDIVQQCDAANVKLFVKQLDLDGKVEHNIDNFPKDLQIRDLPNAKM
ncbi:hypothetical protein LCGC14_0600470 [marine sediment metagenome]|uniref:Phage protein Gp37/Gp68 n=1 Tax=marine sediment metagenome TaxID=412755 RepID=A0A0F9TWT9_9ZZZZ